MPYTKKWLIYITSKAGQRDSPYKEILTDHSRAVPYTRTWLVYWTEQMGKYMSGEQKTIPGGIPVEAFRAVVKACEAGEVDSPYARIIRGEESQHGASEQTPAKA